MFQSKDRGAWMDILKDPHICIYKDSFRDRITHIVKVRIEEVFV